MATTHDEERGMTLAEMQTEHEKVQLAVDEGRREESINMMQTLCDRMKASVNFGEHNVVTLALKLQLGELYFRAKDFEKAKETFESVVESLRKFQEDQVTLSAKFSLANCLHKLVQPNAALESYSELLPLQKIILGDDHPDVIKTLEAIADVNWTLEKFEESLQGYKIVLEKQLRVFGPDIFATTKTKMSIMSLSEKLGRINEAWTVNKEIYASHKRMFGKRDPQTLATRFCINKFLERNASSGHNLPKTL